MRFASLAVAGDDLAAAVLAAGITADVVVTPAIRGVPIAAAAGAALGCGWDLLALPTADPDRWAMLRDGRAPAAIDGRRVLLVDDGIDSGATMHEAVAQVRQEGAVTVAVAVPVAAQEAIARLRATARPDELLVLVQPRMAREVRWAYRDFTAPDDDTVTALLRAGAAASAE